MLFLMEASSMNTQPVVLPAQSENLRRFVPGMAAMFLALAISLVFPVSSAAQSSSTVAVPCNGSFTACGPIPENVQVTFPAGFLAISGDVALLPSLQSNLSSVSDVFHLDNNLLDTGLGTGLGNAGFLFSGSLSTLPNPSTYSANAVRFRESPEGLQFTQYIGNGTDYFLETGVIPNDRGKKAAALPKNAALDLADGEVAVSTSYGVSMGQGPAQAATHGGANKTGGLAIYSTNYTSLGAVQLPFNIVGTNPANGAATTNIQTVIVPINVVFQAGTVNVKSSGPVQLDGSGVVAPTQNSPIFQVADYTIGGTDLGVTQFGDALQRGEFHNIPGFSPDYHVLLDNPRVLPTVTLTVTNAAQGNAYRLRSGGVLGVVAQGFLENQVIGPHFPANVLPIFLTDNVFESADGTINTCCVLGYHNSEGPPASTAATWIYAANTDPGTFVNDAILDVQPLSHEVSEWLNDPFVGALAIGFVNLIPPAVLPGTGGACIINFETGDPLESPPRVFTRTIGGTTYHLQDEVFLPWYLHTTPSFSVNGQYSFNNSFTTPSSLCGPG
jgi:hypothetical protein